MFASSACQVRFALGVMLLVGGFGGESSAANVTLKDEKTLALEYTDSLEFIFILGKWGTYNEFHLKVGKCGIRYLYMLAYTKISNATVYKDRVEIKRTTPGTIVIPCNPKIEKVGGKEKVEVKLWGRLPKDFQVVALNTTIIEEPELATTTANTIVSTIASFASLVRVPIGLMAANVLCVLVPRF